MILNATVKSNKTVDIEYEKTNFLNDVGATGEENATTIVFHFPESLNGKLVNEISDKLVFFKTKDGVYCKAISNDSVSLTKEITSNPVCEMQVALKNGNVFEWRSIPKIITFAESIIDDSAVVIGSLLTEIIDIIRRTVSSSISADISEEEAKNILESNLSILADLKAAFSQLVSFVNQYQGTDYSSADLNQLSVVLRDMWDIGIQLSQAQYEVNQLRDALSSYSSDMQGEEITLDGTVDVIINEVSGELAALINELEALRTDYNSVRSVFENFYLGGALNGNT